MRKLIVNDTEAGMRADIFLANQYPRFTRSSLEIMFSLAKVLMSGSAIKPSYKLKTGDELSVDDSLLKAKPPALDLPIIYEDSNVVVIDKPAGILTHSKGALNLEPTVASFLNQKITDKSMMGNRAGIVHRLDRATSGLIIGAKDSSSLKFLQSQFSNRKVIKKYLAIVEGTPSPAEAIIDVPIARNPSKPQTFKVSGTGKHAITEYKTIKAFERSNKQYSLVELVPRTGRTHQLRVHLDYINHPIVGDDFYGHSGSELMLHAFLLELTLPNGKLQRFSSETPDRIHSFIDV